MEEWAFLFDLLYSYLETCHETWVVLQKLKGRPNYPECRQIFVDTVTPAIHRYAVQLCKLALKNLGRDGQTFIMKRWVLETRSILEEFDVPINKLKLVKVKGGIELNLKPSWQIDLVENTDQQVLYDRSSPSGSTKSKRVKFDMVAVEVLPELVPDLPLVVVACGENSQDDTEIVINPFYLQM